MTISLERVTRNLAWSKDQGGKDEKPWLLHSRKSTPEMEVGASRMQGGKEIPAFQIMLVSHHPLFSL
jgi:hypothetical protein